MTEGPCRRWRPVAMQDEDRARQQVVDLLAKRFPGRAAAEVSEAVDRAWADLADARVRDFVPVLATRSASAALASPA